MKKRQLKKVLSKPSVSVIKIENNDVIVVKYNQHLNTATFAKLNETMAGIFGDTKHKVLVLDAATDVAVLKDNRYAERDDSDLIEKLKEVTS